MPTGEDAADSDRLNKALAELDGAYKSLRESEERQGFLLKLSDALRPLVDPAAIGRTACHLLVTQLNASRAQYAVLTGGPEDPGAESGEILGEYVRVGGAMPRRFPLEPYGDAVLANLRSGRTLVIADAETDTRLAAPARAAFRAVEAPATVSVPLVKGGRFVAALTIHDLAARDWSAIDIELTEATAERSWAAVERARAEAAVAASEEKFRSLFERMTQGYDECELVRDAQGKAVDYRIIEMNPAFGRLIGVSPDEARGRTAREIIPGLEDWWLETFDELVRTGEPRRIEREVSPLGRWYEVNAYPSGGDRFVALFDDITERKRAETALRESEERQVFLLSLSDALRPVADPVQAQATAAGLLGKHLGVDRSNYYEVEDGWATRSQGHDNGAVAVPERFPVAAFGQQWVDRFAAGSTVVISDMNADERFSATEREAWTANKVRASLGVPLVKQGRLRAIFGFTNAEPRDWTAAEIALTEEVAERTWATAERARVEAALSSTEERLQRFGEASVDVLWIRHVKTLQWTYLSAGFDAIYGLTREEALANDNLHTWLGFVVDEDRDGARNALARVAEGENVAFEFRIERPDGDIRWLRDTDFPIRDASGTVTHIGGVGSDVTFEKTASEHQKLLTAELQHRVHNTLAVIRSIARRTAGSSETVEDFAMNLEGRIDAFARVQAVVTRDPAGGVDLAMLVAETLRAASTREGDGLTVEGPQLRLKPKPAETFALGLHELVTNAIKYGALQQDGGRIDVSWSHEAGQVSFVWKESGVRLNGAAERKGLGTEILTRTLPYELKAKAQLEPEADGMRYHIAFPDTALVGQNHRMG